MMTPTTATSKAKTPMIIPTIAPVFNRSRSVSAGVLEEFEAGELDVEAVERVVSLLLPIGDEDVDISSLLFDIVVVRSMTVLIPAEVLGDGGKMEEGDDCCWVDVGVLLDEGVPPGCIANH